MYIEASLNKLQKFIATENYKGFDPYDTLNTRFPFTAFGKFPAAIAIQIQKRNPINIRPLIGIKKDINPKAFGLFLHAYSILYQKNPSSDLKIKIDYFFNWLIKNHTKNFSGICWGYNFDWASPQKILKAHSPTIVVSGFIAKGIFEYYQATKNKKAIEILESIGKFAWQDLKKTDDKTGVCLSYSTVEKDCCYNASMLGAELFSMLFYLTKKEEYKLRAVNLSNYVIQKQHKDGHWNYSISLETKIERKQIDFHQGYILDSLHNVQKQLNLDNIYTNTIKKGLHFYKETQFSPSGKSLWRIPKKWPIDIHNQSQGIITFSRLSEYDPSYQKFAEQIAIWTIDNMQSNNGYFYYRNYPLYKIKIPYMRWSQAWMLLALSELLKNHK